MQRFFFLAAAIHITLAVKPANYVEKAPDKVSKAFKLLFYSARTSMEWKVKFLLQISSLLVLKIINSRFKQKRDSFMLAFSCAFIYYFIFIIATV